MVVVLVDAPVDVLVAVPVDVLVLVPVFVELNEIVGVVVGVTVLDADEPNDTVVDM